MQCCGLMETKMRRIAVTVVLFVTLSAGAAMGRPKADPAIARGHDTAQRACAACHAVEKAGGDSPVSRAVAFASLEMRHTVGLEGRLAELTAKGHYGMPPVSLTAGELADLQVYIESLRPR
jgi:cytochrome c